MNTKIIALLLISTLGISQTKLKLSQIESASGAGQTVITNSLGVMVYTVGTSGTTKQYNLTASRPVISYSNNVVTDKNWFSVDTARKRFYFGVNADQHQWNIGNSSITPIYNFRKDTNGTNYLSIENQTAGTQAVTGLMVNGVPTGTLNAKYVGLRLFPTTYTSVPEFAGSALLSSGGENTSLYGGLKLYSDAGGLKLTTKVTNGGLTFNPDIYIEGAFGGSQATGRVGINTYSPSAQFDVNGSVRMFSILTPSTMITGAQRGLVQVDGNGGITSLPQLRVNYANGGITNALYIQDNSASFGCIAFTNTLTAASTYFTFGEERSTGNYGVIRHINSTNAGAFPYSANSVIFENIAGNNYLQAYNGTVGINVDNNTGTLFSALSVAKTGISTFGKGVVLAAGTTAAGTAPIKMVSGTNMTAIENGAIEYDGSDYTLSSNGIRYSSNKGLKGAVSTTGTATTVFTVTFGGTLPNSTYKVNITPTNALSSALLYVTNKTTTTFDVTYLAGLTGTVAFDWILTQ